MEHYEFVFELPGNEQKEILIARLNNIGFTGFEEDGAQLKAFINTLYINELEFDNIISINQLKYSRSIIKEKNWNAEWESGFEPVTIFYPGTTTPFVNLRAFFHEKNREAVYDIEVTPKMSFGTGHHATTHLMIEEMSQLEFAGQQVIDFGTGTGVLAILAEKLGAPAVTAIDHDDWSIENAKENISKNGCDKISLLKAETITEGLMAGILLANINLNIIIACLHDIIKACRPGATMLFSGIMKHDEPVIKRSLEESSIKIVECRYRNEWLIIRAKI
ncbi:50S ribosomal protein L11 methyltransferase [soil metagenome]